MLALLYGYIIPAAYAVLPTPMQSKEATAMLLAIALQESACTHRRQVGGPARGFWQFEAGGGVTGVQTHPATRDDLKAALLTLRYPATLTTKELHIVLEHNDVLACICARLLLWTLPYALPKRNAAPMLAYGQYLDAWRPGKPHQSTWPEQWDRAWAVIGD